MSETCKEVQHSKDRDLAVGFGGLPELQGQAQGQFLGLFRETVWVNSWKEVCISCFILKQRDFMVRSPHSKIKNSFCFMSLIADVDNVKRILDGNINLYFNIQIYFLGSLPKKMTEGQ